MDKYLRRNEIHMQDVLNLMDEELIDTEIGRQIEIEVKYSGYIEKETNIINRLRQYEEKKIPSTIIFREIKGLSREAQEKLDRIKPESIGQASRISGITPCDLSLIAVYLGKLSRSR